MGETIYLDNSATTMVDEKVIEKMMPYMSEKYGNASSTHSLGVQAKHAIEEARSTIAKSINAEPSEIVFTSGGTESDNMAIKGVAFALKEKGNHIITTKIEHKAIINPCKWLQDTEGFKITYLSVDREGFINLEELESAINDRTVLVSIIHGNNEIGTIQDLEAIGKICRKHGVYFHTDACQSYAKTFLDVKKQNLDLVSLNAHKLNGPKGVGVLYIRKGTKITPLFHGGGHEFNLRSGTENVPGIVGFAEAVKIAFDRKHVEKMIKLRDKLIEGVLSIEGSRLNGPKGVKRLCNNANFSFPGIEGESIGGYLDQKNIASSTGSACSEASLEPSYVLKAIGLTDVEANGSLRLTLSRFTTEMDINQLLYELPGITNKLRKMSPLGRMFKNVLGNHN
ncbi:MAG: cysteine desulfurase family protein [Candidatus Woesearchaeota archaeon]